MDKKANLNIPKRKWPSLGARLTAALFVIAGMLLIGYVFAYPARIGKAQPIAFSHRFHVTQKQISCIFCHEGVFDRAQAGIPPAETCMLCHQEIIITYPEIKKLRNHYDKGIPIFWEKVTDLPDLAHFNHQLHTRKGFDCGRCHGDVAQMDRVVQVQKFEMGFCMECHRQEKASISCYACHY